MKVNENFILRKIAGETLLVPTGEAASAFNGMISLNNVGSFIWEHLNEVNNEDEMTELLLKHYEVDIETAKQDAYGFINMLRQFNMIIEEDQT